MEHIMSASILSLALFSYKILFSLDNFELSVKTVSHFNEVVLTLLYIYQPDLYKYKYLSLQFFSVEMCR